MARGMKLPVLLCFFALVSLLLPGQSAFAQGTCIQDVWKAHGNTQNLGCTANDVRVAFADNIKDVSGNPLIQCVQGQTFSFIADFHVVLTATTRYDIGLYFATDGDPSGDGAITGGCSSNIILPLHKDDLAPKVVMLGSENPPLGSGFINLDPAQDTCGDIDSAHNPQVVTVRVDNVLCKSKPGTNELSLPDCTTWRQPGSNGVCTTAYDAYPGSPSKCNCDMGFTVPIFVDTAGLKVIKTANPTSLPEPGGPVTYSMSVTNTAQYTDITLDRICDDQFGTVASNGGSSCPAGTSGTIESTSCVLPQSLGPGASYSCDFVAIVNGDPLSSTIPLSVTDTVTVSGHDASGSIPDGKASATVLITDVPPTALLTKSLDSVQCALVRYKVAVQNTDPAHEALILTKLIDSALGDITSPHDNVIATTCGLGPGVNVIFGSDNAFTCTFDGYFCGLEHSNTVTATLKDNDGNILITTGSLTVTVGATKK